MNDFWSYWYFHLPNFVLAALMYTLLGRLVLGLFVHESWDNYIWRGFKALTDPIVRGVRFITPDVFAPPVVLIFAALWMMVLRFAYLFVLMNAGLAPSANLGG